MRPVWYSRRLVRIGLAIVGVLLVLLIVAQLLLPGIAADRIRSRVGRYGKVDGVHVSAWPAIELLWGDADSASVRAHDLTLSPARTAQLLWEGGGLDRLDVSVANARLGALRLREVTLHKRGSELRARAVTSVADTHAALPPGFDVQLLGSSGGQVEVRASGGLFGVGASVDAVAQASGGRLLAHPKGFLLEGFQLTLFSEPHVYVTGIGARETTLAGGAAGYVLSLSARLR